MQTPAATSYYIPRTHAKRNRKLIQESTNPNATTNNLFSHILRVILLILLPIIIVTSGILIWFFHLNFNQEQTKNFLFVPRLIDGYKGKILFAHISPKEHKVDLVFFKPELESEIIGGYGTYQLQSLWLLLNIDHKDSHFLSAAGTYFLQNLVDEVIPTQHVPQNFSGLQKFFQENIFKRLILYRFLSSLSSQQANTYQVNTLDDWQKLQDKFHYPQPDTQCSIAVVNSTTTSGLGNNIANIIEKSGYPVIRVTTISQESSTSSLLSANSLPTCAEVNSHLQSLFPFTIKPKNQSDIMEKYRANIVVILGNDLVTALKKKKP